MLSKKSSTVMMLLIVTAAASLLVGISSSTIIYKQAQAQIELPPQLQKPPIPPVTTGSNCPTGYHHVQGDGCAKDTPSLLIKPLQLPNVNQVLKQPQQQQPPVAGAQQQLQTPSQPSLSSAGTTEFNPERQNAKNQAIAQVVADKKLLDRIFPQIIQRLDGKTLAQKIDAATLVQKIDGNTLASKLLPYLDISANVVTRDGPTASMQRTNPIIGQTGWSPLFSTAKCNAGEIAVGGGYKFSSEPEDSFVSTNIPYQQQNGWYLSSSMKASGKLQASVTCLTINVGLKNVQQPQQPALPPAPVPGLR